ncbi:T9SS type A sorting domain-containing protein [Bizionia sp. KMM 8389]
MKKITLLSLFFLALQTAVQAQCPAAGYTCVPDVGFEQALIDFNYDSEGTLDGRILTADAVAATGTLGFANRGILDLTGLEDFINIDGVNFSYNTGITSLDLTANLNLVVVNLEGCSALNSLNVTGLTALEDLNVYGTVLSTVDLLTNSALLVFNGWNSTLQTMDFSGNPAITNVNLRNNILTSVDMRNGNNANTAYRSDFNSILVCVFVDDVTEPNLGTWNLGSGTLVESETACETLSTEKTNQVSFTVYPNPAKERVTITSNFSNNARLGIYDITGKLIASSIISFGDNHLNIAKLAPGVYLMRIQSNGITSTKKLIVR